MGRTSYCVGKKPQSLRETLRRRKTPSTYKTMGCDMADRSKPGIGLTFLDPDEERSPPPSPTPVVFPELSSLGDRSTLSAENLPPFQTLFAKVSKATDISAEHLDALNVTVCGECSLDDLVPRRYIPPLDQLPGPDAPISIRFGGKDRIADYDKKGKAYEERLAELRLENDVGYRLVTRSMDSSTVQGASTDQQQMSRPSRLAHMRKFWEGLESMSRYWDCSLDKYYDQADGPDTQGSLPKRPRLDSFPSSHGNIGGNSTLRAFESDQQSSREDSEDEAGALDGQAGPTLGKNAETIPSQGGHGIPVTQSLRRYKGRRTHSGRDMPELFRVDTVRAFINGTIWPFQCSLVAPRTMPLVQFGTLLLPVKQSASIYRLPADRAKARAGRLEGPLVTVQIRAHVEQAGGPAGSTKMAEAASRLDLLRELGGLFLLAQERRREGQSEVRPGEGMWWTSKPRWGGGLGGEVQAEQKHSETVGAAEEILSGIKTHKDTKDKKRKTPALLWKEVRCGSGRWDVKTEYLAIGKDPRSDIDEIYMVSSLYHHISILKLTIHDIYTDYLLSGSKPSGNDIDMGDVQWHRPRLQRSRWYDLFDVEQRIESFRGLWAVMEYLTREDAARRVASSESIAE